MSDEQILSGGNMEPVVRVGDTVRRVAGPWTPSVHVLLRACEQAGVERVPRALAPFAEDAPGYDAERDGSRDERVAALVAAYGGSWTVDDIRCESVRRLDALAAFTDERAASTGRADLLAHAAMYRRDAERLRLARSQGPFTEDA